MPVDLTGHALLTAEAAALEADELTAQTRLAEDLLGVDPDGYDLLDSADARYWQAMVAMQVGYQLRREEGVRFESFGSEQRSYYADELLSPTARRLRDLHFGLDHAARVGTATWTLDAIETDL